MSQFWEMFAVYKKLDQDQYLRDTEWGRYPPSPDEFFTAQVEGKSVSIKKGNGRDWLNSCSKSIKVKVVGVWDTVGSLGIPDNQWWDFSERNRQYEFHDTRLNAPSWTSTIENASHALALDEHRAPFTPTLWTLPSDQSERAKTTLIQCWFPGVHVNVGGGSDDGLEAREGDLESIANTTFAWMADRCAPFLKFDYLRMEILMLTYANTVAELTEKHPHGKNQWLVPRPNNRLVGRRDIQSTRFSNTQSGRTFF